ncbi:MAG: hypothetical protein IIC82_00500 [Chloroflexi bacterium]|nr:hypothetical protein [Chloroflexota bacterium]
MFSTFIPIAVIGLIHGVDPGHGWPLAISISHGRRRPYIYGAWAAIILGLGHLVSSFFVVGVFLVFDSVFDFSSDVFRYVAGSIMVLIGMRFWFQDGHSHRHDGHTHEHHHEHGTARSHAPTKPAAGLRTLAVSALVLGFAHEEEFALLGLAVGGLNPVTLMTVYSLAVLAALVVVTLVGLAAYIAIQDRIQAALPYMTKFSAVVMIFIGIAFFTGLY